VVPPVVGLDMGVSCGDCGWLDEATLNLILTLGFSEPVSGVSDLFSGSSSCPSGESPTDGFPACDFPTFGFLVGVLDRFDCGVPRAGIVGLRGSERPPEDCRALRLPRSKPCVSCKSLAKRS
jgi:hypothetical protein